MTAQNIVIFGESLGDECGDGEWVGCALCRYIPKLYYFFKSLYLKFRKIGSFIRILLQKSSQKNRGQFFTSFTKIMK